MRNPTTDMVDSVEATSPDAGSTDPAPSSDTEPVAIDGAVADAPVDEVHHDLGRWENDGGAPIHYDPSDNGTHGWLDQEPFSKDDVPGTPAADAIKEHPTHVGSGHFGNEIPFDVVDTLTWYRDKNNPETLHPAIVTCANNETCTVGATVFYPSHIDSIASGIRISKTEPGCVLG